MLASTPTSSAGGFVTSRLQRIRPRSGLPTSRGGIGDGDLQVPLRPLQRPPAGRRRAMRRAARSDETTHPVRLIADPRRRTSAAEAARPASIGAQVRGSGTAGVQRRSSMAWKPGPAPSPEPRRGVPYSFRTGKKKAPGVAAKCPIPLPNLVGAIGLEPTTPTMSRWCSNQLSYAPGEPKIIYQRLGRVAEPPPRCLSKPAASVTARTADGRP